MHLQSKCKRYCKFISNNFMGTAERVQQIIKNSGYTDDEIADLVGVSPSTVWRWRKGKTVNFSKNQLQSIANGLQTDYSWLRFGEKDNNRSNSQDQVNEVDSLYNDLREKAENLNRLPKEGKVQPPSTEEELVRQLEAAQSLIRLAIDNLKKK